MNKLIQIIDENSQRRAELSAMVREMGWHAEIYDSLTEFMSFAPSNGFVLLHDDPQSGLVGGYFKEAGDRKEILPAAAYASAPRPRQIVDAVSAGVVDYLAYPFSPSELMDTLQMLDGAVGEEHAPIRRLVARERLNRLTTREGEVLQEMRTGNTNRTIALHLGISPRTVEIHRSNMMTKLGAQNTAEAIRISYEAEHPTRLMRHRSRG